MSHEEEEMLLFHSFLCFPEHFATDDATPGSSGEQKKMAGRQRRRRKARKASAESGGVEDAAAKKRRLSDEQAQFLEMSFKKDRKLETPRKVHLAAELGLDTNQVAVWFQNRRARYKSKLIEEEFSKLRAAHDAVVIHNCHLEDELLRLKGRLAETEEEKSKIIAVAATAGGGGSSPSSSSFSAMTHAAMVEQFEMEEALTYMSDYDYNNYLIELAAAAGGGYLGCVYDQFS